MYFDCLGPILVSTRAEKIQERTGKPRDRGLRAQHVMEMARQAPHFEHTHTIVQPTNSVEYLYILPTTPEICIGLCVSSHVSLLWNKHIAVCPTLLALASSSPFSPQDCKSGP